MVTKDFSFSSSFDQFAAYRTEDMGITD